MNNPGNKIALLPEQLINQIAAGEVVERPASIVKEMLENSVDAGAKKIVIEIENGGTSKIKITDDGCGMSAEDARLSLQRHATSKIRNLQDLLAVQSMGFRGEALASIASVSKLTLRTRQAESDRAPDDGREGGDINSGAHAGTEIYAEGGQILRQLPAGMPVGTEIEVADLFYNTPARFKFLKALNTEYQNIVDTVLNAALSWPEIAFKLINVDEDGEVKVAMDLPATNDELVRIRGALGKAISDELIPVYYGGVNLKVSGFIGKPALSRANRSMQFFFVNNRPISSHVLSYAVKQAYHSLLPKERYPVFLIKFELEPTMVDVNCHPRKAEVKFRDEREVYRVISMACSKALEEAVLAPKFEQHNLNYYQEKKATGLVTEASAGRVLGSVEKVQVGGQALMGDAFGSATARPEQLSWQNHSNNDTAGSTATDMDSPEIARQLAAGAPDESLEMIVLGQLNNSFILCQRGHDLVLIDQHAAHERIRYNKLMADSENDEKAIQPLLMPINVELSPADIAVLDANKEVLDEVGLKLEHFGGNTFAISEVPSFLAKSNLEKILLGLIDDLRQTEGNLQGHKGDLFSRKEKVLTYMACRSAVKFGDPLSREEMVALVDQIEKTTFGKATCPHGRPVMVVLENSELWSRFGRKYSGFFEKENFGGVNC